MCSTPFGIRGICTPSPAVIAPPATVCSTPFGIRGICTKNIRRGPPHKTGAQRLSASEEYALEESADRTALSAGVLNAFRHQRNMHTQFRSRIPGASTPCSTPFGIRGICTQARITILLTTWPVLNAFRHQRNMHLIDRLNASSAFLVCSTPFGIRGICTWAPADRKEALWQCSTPFGIRGICTPDRARGDATGCVLNAFRHQRNMHKSGTEGGADRGGVLNAFRHQRNMHHWREYQGAYPL